MCALDHRGSLKKMLGEKHTGSVSYQDMVDFKLHLCQVLAPHASAILLDPIYGASQAISAGVLPKGTGLLVSLEETGYSGEAEARITELLSDWSVKKIKKWEPQQLSFCSTIAQVVALPKGSWIR